MYTRKSAGTRMDPWGTPTLTGYFCDDIPSKNHSKPSSTKKKQNKAKYRTWVSVRFEFVKKTSMPYPRSRALNISSTTAQIVPDLLKALKCLSDTNVRRSAVDREDPKPCWKSEMRPHFSTWLTSPSIIYKFFKNFTNHCKKTNTVVDFFCWTLPIILKPWTTDETFQQSGKQDSFRHTLMSSAGKYESLGSVSQNHHWDTTRIRCLW